MTDFVYKGKTYQCRPDETILDALMRQGVEMAFSCRNGICHVCLHRCTKGVVPDDATKGILPDLQSRGYFLPCKCTPTTAIEIEPPIADDLYTPATVYEKEMLSPDICRLLLEPVSMPAYHSGQFINLRNADGVVRSYSLASVPGQDYFLEIHVKRKKNGTLSNWILDELQVNDEIEIQGPQGECFYVPGDETGNLLLVGTGTGLAPLIGIVRDALHHGHSGEIFLYHGAHDAADLYWHKHLLALCGEHKNFHYIACVSGDAVPAGMLAGRVHQVALSCHEDLSTWRIYLAGLSEMVHAAEQGALKAGAKQSSILSDPFLYKNLRQRKRKQSAPKCPSLIEYGSTHPQPDPEMWAALSDGKLLSKILADFYTKVYDDPQLSPFFIGTTKQRSIEKVFSFYKQIFTGEKVFFGDRPRNAHHWMVISNQLFDYRENLLLGMLRKYGLADHLIKRWRRMEESFRRDIVKNEAVSKVVNGIEYPLDGYGEITLEFSSLCDSCGGEINEGELVHYHLRLGTTYCGNCHTDNSSTAQAL